MCAYGRSGGDGRATLGITRPIPHMPHMPSKQTLKEHKSQSFNTNLDYISPTLGSKRHFDYLSPTLALMLAVNVRPWDTMPSSTAAQFAWEASVECVGLVW